MEFKCPLALVTVKGMDRYVRTNCTLRRIFQDLFFNFYLREHSDPTKKYANSQVSKKVSIAQYQLFHLQYLWKRH